MSFLVHICLCVHFRFSLVWCGEESSIYATGYVDAKRDHQENKLGEFRVQSP